MDSRKKNETLYQDQKNVVELGDEELARVAGGWGDGDCDPDWNCDHKGNWWGRCHSYGLLGDLLRDLL